MQMVPRSRGVLVQVGRCELFAPAGAGTRRDLSRIRLKSAAEADLAVSTPISIGRI